MAVKKKQSAKTKKQAETKKKPIHKVELLPGMQLPKPIGFMQSVICLLVEEHGFDKKLVNKFSKNMGYVESYQMASAKFQMKPSTYPKQCFFGKPYLENNIKSITKFMESQKQQRR